VKAGLHNLSTYAGLAARALDVRGGGTRPFKVILALTDRCDCRCTICSIWEKPKGRELSPAEIGSMLAAAPWIRWVNLTGGEPFLREDLVEVVEAAVAALPRLAVLDFPTTGQRTERILDGVAKMSRLGIPRFYVTASLEGPPALHDRLRGRDGAFDNLCRTWEGLRAISGVRAYLGLTLSRENADQAEAAVEAVAARVPGTSWDDVHLTVYTRSAHYYGNADLDAEPAPAALLGIVERVLRRRARSANPADLIEATYLRLLPEHLRTGRSPLPCRSGSASVFIASNGDVYPCTVYDRVLGNVLERPLGEILAGAEAGDARSVIAKDACPGCWSPCEAQPTILASLPGSLLRRPRTAR
jgi:MoaA/NifB/PqqE/SkfB family radical SAM enzyme